MSRDIPFQGPLIEGSYFLEPEELFGMKYSIFHDGWPVPFQFFRKFPIAENISSYRKYQLIYTGYRPIDSYSMHKHYSSIKAYQFILPRSIIPTTILASHYNTSKCPEKRPFLGMRPLLSSDILHFDAKFENANLDRVVSITEAEYDLYIRSDTNSKQKFSWFYFAVTNIEHKRKVKFNIVNMTDPFILYSHGMKPVVSENQIDWTTNVFNVEYTQSKLNPWMTKQTGKAFWMLSFEYEFFETQKKIYFARSIPYTYSQLLKFIDIKSPYLKVKKFCNTISGLSVPKLTITNYKIQKTKKKYVFVVGRLNPGETVSSYIIEGLVNILLSETSEARNTRDHLIYKIIPMANPEGVVIGNSRTNTTGIQLHKKCSEITDMFCTVLKSIKKLAYKLHARGGIFLFIELRGSFFNLGSFLHSWVHTQGSSKHVSSRVLAELIHKISPLSDLVPKDFESINKSFSLKSVFERELRIATFLSETSVFGYKNEKDAVVAHDIKLLQSHGFIIGESIFKYFMLGVVEPSEVVKFTLPAIKIVKKSQSSSDSENYDTPESEISENKMDMETIINHIMKEKIVSQSSFNPDSSSDDENLLEKEFLLDSMQEFTRLLNKRKHTKKIMIKTKIPEAKDIKTRKRIIRLVDHEKINKNDQKIKLERKEFKVSNIDMTSVCIRTKSRSIPVFTENTKKVPLKSVSFYKIVKNKDRGMLNQSYSIPKINYHPVNTIKTRESSSKSKYYKFGPFPNLQEVKSLNFFFR